MVASQLLLPLQDRPFRRFWLGQLISQLGDSVFYIAQSWFVLAQTGSPAKMAAVAVATQIPHLLFLLLGGALADRLPRRLVALWSDLLRGLILLGVTGLVWHGSLTVSHLIWLGGAFGFVSGWGSPAFRALAQVIAPKADRAAVASLRSLGGNLVWIGGPILGGAVMALGGPKLAFLLNGLSFLVGAAGIWGAAVPEPAVKREPIRLLTLLGDLQGALRFLLARRPLLWTILLMALINVVGQAPVIALRPFTAARVGGGSTTLSLALSGFAAGICLSLLVVGSLKVKRRLPVAWAGIGAAGLMMLGMAVVGHLVPYLLLEFLLGGAVMVYGILWEAQLQEIVPPEQMGRIGAVDELGRGVLYPLGLAGVGLLAEGLGAGQVMAIGGGLTLVLGLVGILVSRGELDR